MALIHTLYFELEGGFNVTPVNWKDTKLTANYEGNGLQADIESERFQFANKDSDIIKGLIDNTYGMFMGIPAKLVARLDNTRLIVWDGFFDQSDDYEKQQNKIFIKFQELEGRESLRRLFSGVTFTDIHNANTVQFIDIPFSLEQRFNGVQFALSIIVITHMSKTIVESVKNTADAVNQVIGLTSSSATGGIGAAILSVLNALAITAWTIAMILITVRMVRDVMAVLVPPKGIHKAMTLHEGLKKCFAYHGYELETNIKDLNRFVYLPSLVGDNSRNLISGITEVTPKVRLGIPHIRDFGYIASEFLEMIASLYNVSYFVEGKKIKLVQNNDPNLRNESTYIMPDVFIESEKNNASEARQTTMLTLQSDPSDEWTTENSSGLAIEIKTEPISITDRRYYLVKGLERTDVQMSRGHKKERLTPAETIINEVINGAKNFTKALGGNISIRQPGEFIGKLKTSQSNYSIPKLLDENGLTVDMEYFYTNYHRSKSFVGNVNQFLIFTAQVPMDLDDFLKVRKNKYFRTKKGEEAEFINIDYEFGNDKAQIQFKVKKQYDNKLKEIIYKP